ncbi:serine/threonine-protein phosphatase 4 regulatory subunit 1-like [Sinocyclocheilus rhinocerous]|uniref:serine/threonine-protein phosphatase 4 regulatory subunit 1-like n=1 Tax=Sinocyclocheilus rhinocerous TaxID=307959 RepID=UPI0007B9CED8|nr:PREDICTED: serine/threonine-protein phosphatase 4 regulatory subunit 1-like [Sinocyclocheilus rhinocerous]
MTAVQRDTVACCSRAPATTRGTAGHVTQMNRRNGRCFDVPSSRFISKRRRHTLSLSHTLTLSLSLSLIVLFSPDLSLLQDSQEDTDGLLDFVSQDEMLTPLGRLDKYISSENVFNRQMVARSLLDTLRFEQCLKLGSSEPTVRAELMEQIPHIAIFCQENRPSIPFAFSKFLLPIVVRYLSDQNNLVRKTSQAALLVLREQELMERGDVESLVCPVLVDLTAPDSSDDVKTEAMAIICKMAPMVGKDVTERLFLPRFCEMCCDCRMFHVRKVCAANFGDVCSVVGGEATEELLLPRFFQLCSDNVWGVRKACAECFMTVSSASSAEVRRSKLSSLFISLISDPSRWVRQAAFQSLGPFISTFASSSMFDSSSSNTDAADGGEQTAERLSADESCCLPSSDEIPEQELFNSFHYWRTPIPQIQLELLQEEDRRPSAPALGRTQLQELIENLEPHTDDPDVKAQVDVLTAALRATALDSGLEDAFLEPRAARSNPFSSQQSSEHLSRRDSSLHVTRDDDDSDVSDCCLNPEDQRKSKQQPIVHCSDRFIPSMHCSDPLIPIMHCSDPLKPIMHCSNRLIPIMHCSDPLIPIMHCSDPLKPIMHCSDPLKPIMHCSDRSSVRWTSYRLVLTRTLLTRNACFHGWCVLSPEYFLSALNCQQVALEHTLVSLQTDVDKDVKYFSSVHPGSTRLNEDAMSNTSSTY